MRLHEKSTNRTVPFPEYTPGYSTENKCTISRRYAILNPWIRHTRYPGNDPRDNAPNTTGETGDNSRQVPGGQYLLHSPVIHPIHPSVTPVKNTSPLRRISPAYHQNESPERKEHARSTGGSDVGIPDTGGPGERTHVSSYIGQDLPEETPVFPGITGCRSGRRHDGGIKEETADIPPSKR